MKPLQTAEVFFYSELVSESLTKRAKYQQQMLKRIQHKKIKQ